MYKYSKDVANIEEAEKYNSITSKSRKSIDSSNKVNSVIQRNKDYKTDDMSSSYYLLLDNSARLKETCKSFIIENRPMLKNNDYYRQYIINYNSPEILLQESFLNSQFAMAPIISRKSEDDE